MGAGDLVLGIDVGTTKVAAVVVSRDGKLLASASRPHEADLAAPPGHAEQDVDRLLAAGFDVVGELPADLRRCAAAVGVAGQMHGVVVLNDAGTPLTPLVTWEDQRCLEGSFLDELSAASGHPMRTGFGCATLAWYVASGMLPERAAAACTIHDLLVARLCGEKRPVTDASSGASWGLFDLEALTWDAAAVKAAGIPASVLPEVLPCGAKAGVVCEEQAEKLGLPAGTPAAAALGDNQASVLAMLDDPETELALNVGTGAQLSAALPAGVGPTRADAVSPFDCRPFPGGRFMLVAAALAGGSAWAWLAETVERWLAELNVPCPSRDDLYRRLNALGLAADDALTVKPHFLGERCDAARRGTIEGIDPENFSLGRVARALARGLMVNLKAMLPTETFVGRRAVVGGGNALRRNPLLQEMAKEVFGLPLRLAAGKEEAAVGAALNAANLAGK